MKKIAVFVVVVVIVLAVAGLALGNTENKLFFPAIGNGAMPDNENMSICTNVKCRELGVELGGDSRWDIDQMVIRIHLGDNFIQEFQNSPTISICSQTECLYLDNEFVGWGMGINAIRPIIFGKGVTVLQSCGTELWDVANFK